VEVNNADKGSVDEGSTMAYKRSEGIFCACFLVLSCLGLEDEYVFDVCG